MKSAPHKPGNELMRLGDRLDRLESQLEVVNDVLKSHLDRMRRRRNSSKARLASFSRQAAVQLPDASRR